MRRSLVIPLIVLAFCLGSCATAEWPSPGLNPSGYGSVSLSDLGILERTDTASDVMKKMGSPVGEIPVPWWDYYAADKEGHYYRFWFVLKDQRQIHPRDRIDHVDLVSMASGVAPVLVWPESHGPEAGKSVESDAGWPQTAIWRSPAVEHRLPGVSDT